MEVEEAGGNLLSLCNFTRLLSFLFFFSFSSSSSAASIIPHSLPRGSHPLDEKYYGGEVIECKDGSRSFARDRLNDNFCDCVDGTDEPGTAACPAGKFYCRNLGSTPKFVFSSRVNDNICDCCDGSDEYESSTRCPNTCMMGGTIVYKPDNYQSRTRKIIKTEDSSDGIDSKDKIQKLKGLKLVIAVQLTLIGCLLMLCVYSRRAKSKRRRAH